MSDPGPTEPQDDWGGPTPWGTPGQPAPPPQGPPQPPGRAQEPQGQWQPPPSPPPGGQWQPPPSQWQQPPQAPPVQWQPPGSAVPGGEPVRNYLIASIVVTVLCCLPGGIVAIVYSAQSQRKLGAGDYAGALNASKSARLWLILSVVLGLVIGVIYVIYAVAQFQSGTSTG